MQRPYPPPKPSWHRHMLLGIGLAAAPIVTAGIFILTLARRRDLPTAYAWMSGVAVLLATLCASEVRTRLERRIVLLLLAAAQTAAMTSIGAHFFPAFAANTAFVTAALLGVAGAQVVCWRRCPADAPGVANVLVMIVAAVFLLGAITAVQPTDIAQAFCVGAISLCVSFYCVWDLDRLYRRHPAGSALHCDPAVPALRLWLDLFHPCVLIGCGSPAAHAAPTPLLTVPPAPQSL